MLAGASLNCFTRVAAVEITVSNGTIEVVQDKWSINVYVRQFDPVTQTYVKLTNFLVRLGSTFIDGAHIVDY